jgi:urease accessory protein
MEGVVVAVACRAAHEEDWPAIVAANQLLRAGVAPATLRQASRDMGEQLLALAENWPWAADYATALRHAADASPDHREWHHAAVFGTLSAAAGAMAAEAVAVFLHQAALGTIGAGVRAIPIGHTHGQQILARLHDDIQTLAVDLAGRGLDTAGSFCPAYELLCHAQSHLYTRLFRS